MSIGKSHTFGIKHLSYTSWVEENGRGMFCLRANHTGKVAKFHTAKARHDFVKGLRVHLSRKYGPVIWKQKYPALPAPKIAGLLIAPLCETCKEREVEYQTMMGNFCPECLDVQVEPIAVYANGREVVEDQFVKGIQDGIDDLSRLGDKQEIADYIAMQLHMHGDHTAETMMLIRTVTDLPPANPIDRETLRVQLEDDVWSAWYKRDDDRDSYRNHRRHNRLFLVDTKWRENEGLDKRANKHVVLRKKRKMDDWAIVGRYSKEDHRLEAKNNLHNHDWSLEHDYKKAIAEFVDRLYPELPERVECIEDLAAIPF